MAILNLLNRPSLPLPICLKLIGKREPRRRPNGYLQRKRSKILSQIASAIIGPFLYSCLQTKLNESLNIQIFTSTPFVSRGRCPCLKVGCATDDKIRDRFHRAAGAMYFGIKKIFNFNIIYF